MRILTTFKRRMEEFSKNVNRDLKNIRKNQSEIQNKVQEAQSLKPDENRDPPNHIIIEMKKKIKDRFLKVAKQKQLIINMGDQRLATDFSAKTL